ncbi:MAG: acyl-CoA transferase [Alphaproteobacteria bacterium]|nr:acyl-CoA transferase [Alphaproteobacteria bacterium]
MTSKREQALAGLFLYLQNGISGVAVLRNEPLPTKIPASGLLILRDGDAGELEITLSPTRYHYAHVAELEVLVQKPKPDERDAALDALLMALGDVLSIDTTLSGAVDYMSVGSPEFLTETVEGAPAIKAAVVPITLEYTTLNPLQ